MIPLGICGGNSPWVWQCFTRKHPIYMDGYFDDAGAPLLNYDIIAQIVARALWVHMNLACALPSGSWPATAELADVAIRMSSTHRAAATSRSISAVPAAKHG